MKVERQEKKKGQAGEAGLGTGHKIEAHGSGRGKKQACRRAGGEGG